MLCTRPGTRAQSHSSCSTLLRCFTTQVPVYLSLLSELDWPYCILENVVGLLLGEKNLGSAQVQGSGRGSEVVKEGWLRRPDASLLLIGGGTLRPAVFLPGLQARRCSAPCRPL